jgi:hypothetical protein
MEYSPQLTFACTQHDHKNLEFPIYGYFSTVYTSIDLLSHITATADKKGKALPALNYVNTTT